MICTKTFITRMEQNQVVDADYILALEQMGQVAALTGHPKMEVCKTRTKTREAPNSLQ